MAGVVVMTVRTAGARRPFLWTRSAGGVSRGTRIRRAAQWLLAVLLLCEWRYPPPTVLQSEQRSARSALRVRSCRKSAACTGARSGAMGAWTDSLTYLSFD